MNYCGIVNYSLFTTLAETQIRHTRGVGFIKTSKTETVI